MNMLPYGIQKLRRDNGCCLDCQAEKKNGHERSDVLRLIDMSEDFYQEVADKFIFTVKKGLLYTESDAWVKIRDDGILLGVTDFLQRRGGDVVFVQLPQKGKTVMRGEEFSSFETIKAVVPVSSPLDGVVAEVNSALNDKPELINMDPYGEGWLVLISPSRLEEDRRFLMTAERYFELMKSKIAELRKDSKGVV